MKQNNIVLLILTTLVLAGCNKDKDKSSTPSAGTSNVSATSTTGNEPGTSAGEPGTSGNHSGGPTSEAPAFVVTFVTNSTEALAPVTTSLLQAPPAVSNSPLVLDAWYFDAAFTRVVTFPLAVTENVTLYARWVESSGGINYRINSANNGYIVESYTGNAYDVVIPSYYEALPVVAIGDYVFYEQGSIVSVTLPETITAINYAAFKNATALTAIVLPASLKTIGNDAFSGATSLASVSNNSALETIGNNAFENTALTTITLPSSLLSMGARAFANNSKLVTVNIHATTPPLVYPSSFDEAHSNLKINVPNAALNTYKNDPHWSGYSAKLKAL